LEVPPPGAEFPVEPLLFGGGQERGLRSGTPSVAHAAAAARALALAQQQLERRSSSLRAARDAFVAILAAELPGCTCLTPLDQALPNTAMLRFAGAEGRLLLPALDVAGIQASHGSACSSGSPKPPAVLAATGLAPDAARQCVRFSFGCQDGVEWARQAARRVKDCVSRLLRRSSAP